MQSTEQRTPIDKLKEAIRSQAIYLWTHKPDNVGVFPNVNFSLGEWREILSALERADHETQQSITQWADETFGKVTSLGSCLRRAIEEMEEFKSALCKEDAAKEAADVVIVLYRTASIFGFDLNEEIDRKMYINRQRKWRKDGTGHGYHIKEGVTL